LARPEGQQFEGGGWRGRGQQAEGWPHISEQLSEAGTWRSDSGTVQTTRTRRTHNTGFTAGTAAFRPRMTHHAEERQLEREIDERLIRHTVVRGRKTQIGEKWRFEKDGVVVISSAETPEQSVITTWLEQATYQKAMRTAADDEYKRFVDRLDDSLDEEERLEKLIKYLSDPNTQQLTSMVSGVDRALHPMDEPLLHHCVAKGFVECLRAMLDCGEFDDAIGKKAKRGMNLMHLAAWNGRPEVLPVLEAHWKNLCDLPSDFNELPEQTGWLRYCDQKSATPNAASSCLEVAIHCATVRKQTPVSEKWFVEQAGAQLRQAQPSNQRLVIPPGADAQSVAEYFAENAVAWRTQTLTMKGVDLSGAQVLGKILDAQSGNHSLTEVSFERCGLTPACVPVLKSFLGASAIQKLTLSYNPLLSVESVQELLCTQNLCASLRVLELCGMDWTVECLAPLARVMVRSGLNKVLRLLSLDHNDFCETPGVAPGVPGFADFARYLRSDDCRLKELALRVTRLREQQLLLLWDAIRTAPELTRLHIQGVTVPERFMTFDNELVTSLQDMNCRVKYVEVSPIEYPELFRRCRLICDKREKRRTQGDTAVTLCPIRPSGQGSAVVEVNNRKYRGWHFSAPVFARISSVTTVRVDKPATVTLETQFGTLDRCFNFSENEFVVGDLCLVDLGFRDARVVIKGVHDLPSSLPQIRADDLSFQQAQASEELAETHVALQEISVLRGLRFVVVHRQRNKVLLERERGSESGKVLWERMRIGLLADHLASEERFQAGVSNKQLQKMYTFPQLLQDLAMDSFADEEVSTLSAFDTSEGYAKFCVGGEMAWDAVHEARFTRVAQAPVVHDLVEAFQLEEERRRGLSRPTEGKPLQMMGRPCSHFSVMGHAHTHAVFMWPLDKLKLFIEDRMPMCREERAVTVENLTVLASPQGHHSVLAVVLVGDGDIDANTGFPKSMSGDFEWTDFSEVDIVAEKLGYSAAANAIETVAQRLL